MDLNSTELSDPGILPSGEFEINGIRFPIPPNAISFSERNNNFKFETLRTRESTKSRSGQSQIDFVVSAIFTGVTEDLNGENGTDLGSINNTLMPILYSLKRMPLCFIKNELLYTVLPVVPDENIGAFLKMVNISTVRGMPYALSAEFQFTWYNHRPFTPRIKFRKEWVDNNGMNSVAEFRNIYASLKAQGEKETQSDSDTGRAFFIKNYGHPSTVYNATAYHSQTENIFEARPLNEYLWPYKYKSTNPAVLAQKDGPEAYLAKTMSAMPAFHLSGFNENIAFDFTIMKAPKTIETPSGPKSVGQILQEMSEKRRLMAARQVAEELTKQNPLEAMHAIRTAVSGKLLAPIPGKLKYNQVGGRVGMRHGRMHGGTDLQGPVGTPVRAVMDGIVFKVQTEEQWRALPQQIRNKEGKLITNPAWRAGAFVAIRHPNGNTSKYIHLQNVRAKVGPIKQGEVFAEIGLTAAKANFPHLHFEYRQGRDADQGPALDPISLGLFVETDMKTPVVKNDTTESAVRISAVMDPMGMAVLALQNHATPIAPEAMTRDQLKETARKIGANPKTDEDAVLVELANAIDGNWYFVQNAVTGKIAQITQYTLDTADLETSVIPTDINVGFGNNLVMMPLDGHRFPTIQYTGGQHTVATISIRAEGSTGREFLRLLQNFQNSYEYSAISFREFARRQGVSIRNDLLNALNIKNVLIESINVDTVQGSPGGLDITLRLIDNTINEQLRPIIVPSAEANYNTMALKVVETLLKKRWISTEVTTNKGFGTFLKEEISGSGSSAVSKITIETAYNAPRSMVIGSPQIRALADLLARTIPVPFGRTDKDLIAYYSEEVEAGEYFLENEKAFAFEGRFQRGVLYALFGDRENPGALSDLSFKIWASGPAQSLVLLLGSSDNGAKPLDNDFAKLYATVGSSIKYDKSNQAFPDLLLPPNPITGLSVDTNPDFFLVNESDVNLCNSATLEKILGTAGASTRPKARGMRYGMVAIDQVVDNYLRILGVHPDQDQLDGTVRAANKGRSDIYIGDNGVNKGKFKTTGTQSNIVTTVFKSNKYSTPLVFDRAEATPDPTVLATINGVTPVLQNDIAARKTGGYESGKPYQREKTIPPMYDQSAYADQLISGFNDVSAFGERLENGVRIQHKFEQGAYKEVFSRFAEKYSSDHYTVRRSFPTFKIFFVEEDGELGLAAPDGKLEGALDKLGQTVALDDFYGVNAIKEISIVHAKDMAASTCVIQLLDVDGILYNRKYNYKTDGSYRDIAGPIDIHGRAVKEKQLVDDDNPFYSTVIKEGMKVVVKFGYVNDPNELETVFVGQIAQFEGDKLITIVCQGYGTELVAKRFGDDPSENVDIYNTTTADLLYDILDREELRHFGRWQLKDVDLFGGLFGHEKLRPDGKVKTAWTWKPSVVDDNLFIPDTNTYASSWARIWGDLEYVYWDTTIWDVFKEMELRHPGYIAYPVPYGNSIDTRMTMFFGQPDQLYLSRPANDMDELRNEFKSATIDGMDLRNSIINLGRGHGGVGLNFTANAVASSPLVEDASLQEGIRLIANTGGDQLKLAALAIKAGAKDATLFAKYYPQAKAAVMEMQKATYENFAKGNLSNPRGAIDSDQLAMSTLAFQRDRLRPFRNYEMVTSLHDIISNSIKVDHRDTFNSVELHYSDNDVNFGTFFQEAPEVLTVNADDNIREHHIRRTIEAWPNCTTTDLARRYASQLLANSLKRVYKGTLTIVGRAKLKPYDMLWVHDNYADMAGPIEIEEVVHTFSPDTGFISEIVPNMVVTVREEVTTLMVDAVSQFFTEQIKDFTNGALLGLGITGLLRSGIANLTKGSAQVNEGVAFAQNAPKVLEATKVQPLTLEETIWSNAATNAAEAAPILQKQGIENMFKGGAFLGGGIGLIPTAIRQDINGEKVAGFATGAATAIAFEFLPITVSIAAIIAGSCLYKFLKYNSTREPILITPLIKEGKPYISGVEGMETDGLLITDLSGAIDNGIKKWRYYTDGLEDAVEIIKFGVAKWWSTEY